MRGSSRFDIHLSHLSENFSALKELAPSNEVIFMVKANAYGHGLVDIVSYAYKELKITKFGLAALGEAVLIRKRLPEVKAELYVFSDIEIQNEDSNHAYTELNIKPIISNMSDLQFVLECKEFSKLPLFIKFDTGMNRLGIKSSECDKLIRTLKKSQRDSIEHVLTHYASSYIPLKENDRTHKQYDKFKTILSELRTAGININETSCANSGAIEQKFSVEKESHIRPGLMMYGAKSHPKSLWTGKPISDLRAEILKVEPVKKGTPVGYGAHICSDHGYLVYLALGYGDGILTYYSGKKIKLYGTDCKILGRVNMDITTVFFKELPKKFQAGELFNFWGGEADSEEYTDVSELAHQLNTTAYQVFTAISSRVPRRYLV